MKTNKTKKVLIALDYNPNAQIIAETGYALAKSMNAEVVLLHTVLDLVYYSSTYMNMGPLQLDGEKDMKNAASHFLDKTREHLGDNTIRTMVKEGDFAESILETAHELQADIIVMGSQSRRWLENMVLGSVTEKVLHNTPIPLFIVPTKKYN